MCEAKKENQPIGIQSVTTTLMSRSDAHDTTIVPCRAEKVSMLDGTKFRRQGKAQDTFTLSARLAKLHTGNQDTNVDF